MFRSQGRPQNGSHKYNRKLQEYFYMCDLGLRWVTFLPKCNPQIYLKRGITSFLQMKKGDLERLSNLLLDT